MRRRFFKSCYNGYNELRRISFSNQKMNCSIRFDKLETEMGNGFPVDYVAEALFLSAKRFKVKNYFLLKKPRLFI